MWNFIIFTQFSSIKKCNKDDKTPCSEFCLISDEWKTMIGLMTVFFLPIYGLEKSVNKYFKIRLKYTLFNRLIDIYLLED